MAWLMQLKPTTIHVSSDFSKRCLRGIFGAGRLPCRSPGSVRTISVLSVVGPLTGSSRLLSDVAGGRARGLIAREVGGPRWMRRHIFSLRFRRSLRTTDHRLKPVPRRVQGLPSLQYIWFVSLSFLTCRSSALLQLRFLRRKFSPARGAPMKNARSLNGKLLRAGWKLLRTYGIPRSAVLILWSA